MRDTSIPFYTTNKDIYELLCTQVGYSENELRRCASQIREILTENVWLDIRNSIPSDCTMRLDMSVFVKARVYDIEEGMRVLQRVV